MNICVYCASSDHIDSAYADAAHEMGERLVHNGHALVYGGGQVGLMGIIARQVHEGGGHVVGVIPEKLKDREGVAYGVADELIVTATMRERKKIMYERADAFAVLPGGYGTLEEFMEVLTLRQLGYHRRPIVLVNINGFFDPLMDFFERLREERFTRANHDTLMHVTDTAVKALAYIEQNAPAPTTPDGAF